jgi:hypothetical protein
MDNELVGNLTLYTEDKPGMVYKSEPDHWCKAKRLLADKLVGIYKVANCLVELGSWSVELVEDKLFRFRNLVVSRNRNKQSTR